MPLEEMATKLKLLVVFLSEKKFLVALFVSILVMGNLWCR